MKTLEHEDGGMKNVIFTVAFAVIGGLVSLVVGLGSYTFAQSIQKLDNRVETVEAVERGEQESRRANSERLARVETKLEKVGDDIAEIKQQSQRRDEKLDKIIDQLQKVEVDGARRTTR